MSKYNPEGPSGVLEAMPTPIEEGPYNMHPELIAMGLSEMPPPVTRHLVLLECGELALQEAMRNTLEKQPEACHGADDVARAILVKVTPMPIDIVRMGKHEGVRLSPALFQPLPLKLSHAQETVYHEVLALAEHRMRRLYDSNLLYPDVFQLENGSEATSLVEET